MNGYKKNIIWLASYPKSGNTWVRIFLNSILGNAEEDLKSDTLEGIPIASNRFLIDQYLGVPSSDLTEQEIYDLRPAVYREISNHSEGTKVLKVHDAFGLTSMGSPLFPHEITRAVIYIIRNPLDVAVSYAFHSNSSFDISVQKMNNPEFTISRNTNQLKVQVAQHLGSWSKHVASWIDQNIFDVQIIRYEDLIHDASGTFFNLLNALKISFDENSFSTAMGKSDFQFLQASENDFGFKEKPLQAASFFREGKAGVYPKYLNDGQTASIIKAHYEMMKRFGYINDTK